MTLSSKLCLVAGLLLAIISLTFSATGLVHLFVGGGWTIVAMMVAFEIAKVASTLYIAQHLRWSVSTVALTVGLTLLSCVSVVGVLGYLSRAYSTGQAVSIVGSGTIEALSSDISSLSSEKDRLLRQVEAIPAAQGTNRRKMLAQVEPQISALTVRIRAKQDTLSTYTREQAGKEQDVGELKYAAAMLGIEQEKLVMWVITVLSFLLDPLAITLIFASGIKGQPQSDHSLASDPVQLIKSSGYLEPSEPWPVPDDPSPDDIPLPSDLSPALQEVVKGKRREKREGKARSDVGAVAKLHPRNK